MQKAEQKKPTEPLYARSQRVLAKMQQSAPEFEKAYLSDIRVVTPEELPKGVVIDHRNTVLFEYTFREVSLNLNETMHGGSSASIQDICATVLASASHNQERLFPITIESQFSYHRPVEFLPVVYFRATLEKASKRFASATVDILDSKRFSLLNSGKILKAYDDWTQKL